MSEVEMKRLWDTRRMIAYQGGSPVNSAWCSSLKACHQRYVASIAWCLMSQHFPWVNRNPLWVARWADYGSQRNSCEIVSINNQTLSSCKWKVTHKKIIARRCLSVRSWERRQIPMKKTVTNNNPFPPLLLFLPHLPPIISTRIWQISSLVNGFLIDRLAQGHNQYSKSQHRNERSRRWWAERFNHQSRIRWSSTSSRHRRWIMAGQKKTLLKK